MTGLPKKMWMQQIICILEMRKVKAKLFETILFTDISVSDEMVSKFASEVTY